MNAEALLQELVALWGWGLLSLIGAMWVKDFATSIAKGIRFRMSSYWQEGDVVLLDGDKATITKIGLNETVFLYSCPKYTRVRVVANDRLSYLRLEKIIDTSPEKG